MIFKKGEYVVSKLDCNGLTIDKSYKVLGIDYFTYHTITDDNYFHKNTAIVITIKNDFDYTVQENILYFDNMSIHRNKVIDGIFR